MQSALVIIDKDTGRDVHRVDKAESLFDVAFCHYLCDLLCDIDKCALSKCVKCKVCSLGSHTGGLSELSAAAGTASLSLFFLPSLLKNKIARIIAITI